MVLQWELAPLFVDLECLVANEHLEPFGQDEVHHDNVAKGHDY